VCCADFFFRELTGDVYSERERIEDGNTAYDTMICYSNEVERIARSTSLDAAMTRGKKLTPVDKANALNPAVYGDPAQEIAKEYPEEVTHQFVDSCDDKDQRPKTV
jgi:3-isopropylmalate dehydrogenase